jgi:thioredoxin-like negative regulator of GroEL
MEHPNYAQLLGSHARVVEESGDASRARAMLEEAWQRGRESLGTEHPWVVETGERLQRALLEAGDTSAAQAVEAALPDSAARPTAGAPN